MENYPNTVSTAQKIAAEVTEWRRELHRFPQTSYEETFISGFVSQKLNEFNIDCHTGLAKTGVVGVIKGNRPGKRIALRADIDALNIHEENEFAYRSEYSGKMHACGHDGHTAMLLGAAKMLADHRDFGGEAVLIFQPAEEGGAGGKKMLEDGLFEKFPVDSIWGMHNWPGLPVGSFAMNHGGFMASTWDIHITLTGIGGHAAAPHKSRDVIPAVAALVNSLQSVVSRSADPLKPCVLSITGIHAGTATNIIPEHAEVFGTLRTLDEQTQTQSVERLKSITAHVAETFGVKAAVREAQDNYPVLVNTAHETDIAYEVTKQLVGEANTKRDFPPIMGAEDFAFMLQKKPGSYIFVGNGNYGEKGGANLHSSKYDFNDDAIPFGIAYWVSLVKHLSD